MYCNHSFIISHTIIIIIIISPFTIKILWFLITYRLVPLVPALLPQRGLISPDKIPMGGEQAGGAV
jgi:hypothetical protein